MAAAAGYEGVGFKRMCAWFQSCRGLVMFAGFAIGGFCLGCRRIPSALLMEAFLRGIPGIADGVFNGILEGSGDLVSCFSESH